MPSHALAVFRPNKMGKSQINTDRAPAAAVGYFIHFHFVLLIDSLILAISLPGDQSLAPLNYQIPPLSTRSCRRS